MITAGTLCLVVTGAPLARRIDEAINAAEARGWATTVIATESALGWLDPARLQLRGVPVLSRHRALDEPKRQPAADAFLVAPASFNSMNKLAAGIADSYPLSVLAEALGAGKQMIMVPFVNAKLAGHPVWPETLSRLRTAEVMIMDPHNGDVDDLVPTEPGTGDTLADQFDWAWPLDALRPGSKSQRPR